MLLKVVVLQGAAVTLAELGEYTRAASLLEELTEVGWPRTGYYMMKCS